MRQFEGAAFSDQILSFMIIMYAFIFFKPVLNIIIFLPPVMDTIFYLTTFQDTIIYFKKTPGPPPGYLMVAP